MSGITGIGSPAASFALPTATPAPSDAPVATDPPAPTLSPLQRAQALAQTAGGSPVFPNEQFAIPYIPTASSDFSYSYDYATGSYSWAADTAFGDTASVFDQIGILTPVTTGFSSTFQQITNPSGNTPGESQTVALQDQISYRQQVADRTPPAGQPQPANQAPANLGRIGTNAGRLVLVGNLDNYQGKTDSYTFNLQDAGNLRVLAPDPNSSDPTASLGPVHLQIFDSSGTLLADSDPTSGEPYLTYVKLDQSAITGPQFDKGQYTIKLGWNGNVDPTTAKGDYSLFIVEGTDPGRVTYYTAEKAPQTKPTVQPATISNLQPPVLGLFA
jgi:hypothetical protein